MASSLVSGSKENLLKEFKELKPVHGTKWRSVLKQFNPWHNTAEGLYAWQNALRGSVGNEALRTIVGDMKIIFENKKNFDKQGEKVSPKKLADLRAKSIKQSIENLTNPKGKTMPRE